jgi:vancomycin resistance protein YoaR
MTFRNDTEHPIVIRGFGGRLQVTFQMWSVPNGRTVVMSDPVDEQPALRDRDDAGRQQHGAGYARRVEYPHHGFTPRRTDGVRPRWRDRPPEHAGSATTAW